MKHEFSSPRRTAVALDPHPLCHTALATLLAGFEIDLVGAATSTSTAATLLQEHRPDLLILEVDLPEGLDAALRLISNGPRETPGLTVIVLSGSDDRSVIDAAFDRGASSYVLKTSDLDAIGTAVRQAFEPSLYLARPTQQALTTTDRRDVLRKLTRRELEILQLVSGGRSNRQVAEILWVADQTVKFHLANVYRKLGVRSRFEAARWARENGVLDVAVEPVEPVAKLTMPRRGTNGHHTASGVVSIRRSLPRNGVATDRFEETSR